MRKSIPVITGKRSKTRARVADSPGTRYTGKQRNRFSLEEEADHFKRILSPLKHGNIVTLAMTEPVVPRKKQAHVKRERLVVITPGRLFGAKPGLILISIVGKGACLVDVIHPHVANLVLAGMPVRLAKELMNQLHRILLEV